MSGRHSYRPHGSGKPAKYTIADPAVNTELSFIPNAGILFQPTAIRFELNTDANAGNRFPILKLTKATSVIYAPQYPQPTSAISSIEGYSYILGMSMVNLALAEKIMGFPLVLMDFGDTITTSTVNMQVGDQFTNFTIIGLEWKRE